MCSQDYYFWCCEPQTGGFMTFRSSNLISLKSLKPKLSKISEVRLRNKEMTDRIVLESFKMLVD